MIEDARERKEDRLRKQTERVRGEEVFKREQVVDRQVELREREIGKRKAMELKLGEKNAKNPNTDSPLLRRRQSEGAISSLSSNPPSPLKPQSWALPQQHSYRT